MGIGSSEAAVLRRLDRLTWTMVATVAAVVLAAPLASNFYVEWTSFAPPAACCLALVAGAQFYRNFRRDPKLASEVMALARHLRWDVEEDLSKLFGDMAAHRLADAGRAFAAWHVDAARRLAESLADYAVDEKRVLMARPEMESFAGAVARLRDAVERLEKRVQRLG